MYLKRGVGGIGALHPLPSINKGGILVELHPPETFICQVAEFIKFIIQTIQDDLGARQDHVGYIYLLWVGVVKMALGLGIGGGEAGVFPILLTAVQGDSRGSRR